MYATVAGFKLLFRATVAGFIFIMHATLVSRKIYPFFTFYEGLPYNNGFKPATVACNNSLKPATVARNSLFLKQHKDD